MKKSVIITIVCLGLVIAGLAVAVAVQHSRIKEYKQQIADNAKVIEYLTDRNEELANIDGINIKVELNVKQTNVLSAANNTFKPIVTEICQMTRGEILDSLAARKQQNNK